MLKEIIQNLQKLIRIPVQVDPSKFEDPVAIQTQWTPAKGGGSSFCTHEFVNVGGNRVEFKATIGAKLFYLVFGAMGLFFLPLTFAFDNSEQIIALIMSFPFIIVSAVLYYYGTMPIVFDRCNGYFWKGWKLPEQILDKNSIKYLTLLDNIHALQLISEHCHSKNSSFYSYELNLVLENGERINVIDHGNLNKIKQDIVSLSNFLGKPVWDGTQYIC